MTKDEARTLIIRRNRLQRHLQLIESETVKSNTQDKIKQIDRILEDNEVWICSICGNIQIGYMSQNNAYPVKKEPCCDACNLHYVIPARIKQSGGW